MISFKRASSSSVLRLSRPLFRLPPRPIPLVLLVAVSAASFIAAALIGLLLLSYKSKSYSLLLRTLIAPFTPSNRYHLPLTLLHTP